MSTLLKVAYIVTLEVRVGMINAVIEDTNDNALPGDSFTPDRNDVNIIANSASRLTSVYLNTNNQHEAQLLPWGGGAAASAGGAMAQPKFS